MSLTRDLQGTLPQTSTSNQALLSCGLRGDPSPARCPQLRSRGAAAPLLTCCAACAAASGPQCNHDLSAVPVTLHTAVPHAPPVLARQTAELTAAPAQSASESPPGACAA